MQMNVFYGKKETIQMKFLEICKAEIDLVREIKGMKLESEIRNKMYWFDSNKGKIREFRWVIINNKITWINEYLSVIYLVDKKEGKHESFHNESDIIADEYRYLGVTFTWNVCIGCANVRRFYWMRVKIGWYFQIFSYVRVKCCHCDNELNERKIS